MSGWLKGCTIFAPYFRVVFQPAFGLRCRSSLAQSNPASDGLPLQRWVPRTPLSYNTMGVAYAYPFPCKAASQTRVWSSAGGWTWLDLLDLLDFRNQALQLVGANEELMIEVGFFGGFASPGGAILCSNS